MQKLRTVDVPRTITVATADAIAAPPCLIIRTKCKLRIQATIRRSSSRIGIALKRIVIVNVIVNANQPTRCVTVFYSPFHRRKTTTTMRAAASWRPTSASSSTSTNTVTPLKHSLAPFSTTTKR